MSIKAITTDELRKKKGEEGLILQGCGGDPQEWLDAINELLTKEEILLGGSRFENCESFTHDGSINLFFPFEGVKLNMGKLAMWRLRTHDKLNGTWLSDYVPNYLGGYLKEQKKPNCPLIGQDGNIFNLMGIAARTLRRNGMGEQAKEMTERITTSAGNYYKALDIIGEYVNITSVDDEGEEKEKNDFGEDEEEEITESAAKGIGLS